MGKVLIIDDEKQILGLLSRIIGLEGYEVLQAATCKAGLRQMEQHSPEVVLCDVFLPDGNGVDLVSDLKKLRPLSEIILLTAHGNIPDGVQAIKNGAFDYITKGDDNNKIIPLVAKAMEKASAAYQQQKKEATSVGRQYSQGHFREDLFYRLSVFQIHLPALRERVEDIPLHIKAFVSAFSSKMGKNIRTISPEYIDALKKRAWKGNVRELRNAIERSLIIADGDTLTLDALPLNMQTSSAASTESYSGFDLSGVEKMHIQKVLKYTKGNKTETSRLLGIGLTTLYRKIEEYGL